MSAGTPAGSPTPGRDVETKLRAARTRLVLERPFIGALVMHLPLAAAAWCETVATDARRFHYNPAYIAALSFAQTQFVLAHEALHCALGHFARRAHRVRRRWDVACDHAVNLLLVEEGLVPPPGALVDSRYRGLSAEEIYPLVAEDTEERTLDRHLFEETGTGGGGGGAAGRPDGEVRPGRTATEEPAQRPEDEHWSDAAPTARGRSGTGGSPPSPVPEAAAGSLEQDWRMRMAAAAQQARHAGRIGIGWQRVIDRVIEPRLAWRTLLARYLVSAARDDYSFQRPSRREGVALMPQLHSGQIDVIVALDTSGSIGEAELREFATEVDALKGQVRARVTLHACDDALATDGPWIFQPWQSIVLPDRLSGGGGTDFRPVFAWIADEGLRPDLLLFFTDAEGEFPPAPPPYPVVWLVKGRAEVPWGDRVQLN